MLKHVLEDFPSRRNLAMALLYQQFALDEITAACATAAAAASAGSPAVADGTAPDATHDGSAEASDDVPMTQDGDTGDTPMPPSASTTAASDVGDVDAVDLPTAGSNKKPAGGSGSGSGSGSGDGPDGRHTSTAVAASTVATVSEHDKLLGRLLSSMQQSLDMSLKSNITLLRQLVRQAPRITAPALRAVSGFCLDKQSYTIGLLTLRDLVLERPKVRCVTLALQRVGCGRVVDLFFVSFRFVTLGGGPRACLMYLIRAAASACASLCDWQPAAPSSPVIRPSEWCETCCSSLTSTCVLPFEAVRRLSWSL